MMIVESCNHKAAKHAVTHWHYSKTMPIGRLVRHGVWSSGQFIGAIIYGRGSSRAAMRFLGLEQGRWCELVRVALNGTQDCHTSKILAMSIRKLMTTNPNLQAVLSFADPEAGHLGILYQASNWLYFGLTSRTKQFFIRGRWVHSREASGGAFGQRSRYSKDLIKELPSRLALPKFRYVYPMSKENRKKWSRMSSPYPKRVNSDQSDTLPDQGREDGAIPILTLNGSSPRLLPSEPIDTTTQAMEAS